MSSQNLVLLTYEMPSNKSEQGGFFFEKNKRASLFIRELRVVVSRLVCFLCNFLKLVSIIIISAELRFKPLNRGAFCQSSFRWIYYCGSNKSTGKETGKSHLCAMHYDCLSCLACARQETKLSRITYYLDTKQISSEFGL